jgi:anthranilate 1,2-dioxygenase small subunit/terephthalate 1,2-dioxygenase oxygenase component beta subunit
MDSDTATLFRLTALNSDYAACIDADRLEEFPYFFLEDCVYKITTADNHRRGYAAGVIYADSRAMLLDRVAALREANIYERHTYRHIVGMPRVSGEAGATTEATGAAATAAPLVAETPFLVVRTMRDGRMDIFAAGRYLDRVAVDSDGTLRFAERVVVCDSARFDTLLAIPL